MHIFQFREPVNAWTHALGLVLAVPGTVYLWRRSRGAPAAQQISVLIFGVSLMFCYAASMLFHAVRISAAGIGGFDRLDRIGIFVLIAGTYTPLAWALLRGRWRWVPLVCVWSVTGVATGLLALGGPLSPAWMTGLYLAMGWGVVGLYAELAKVVSHRALLPLVAGGGFYSLGAVLNVLHRPVIWPGVFEAHELFHLFVMAGSLAHYYLVIKVVLPMEPMPGATPAVPGMQTFATPIRAPRQRGQSPTQSRR